NTNVIIGKSITIDELMQEEGFEAVFIGSGAGLPMFMGIPGEQAKGVFSANEFLTRNNLMKAFREDYDTPISCGKKVCVVGGGNVAMDAARTAVRLNAASVHVFTRKRDDITALAEEVEGAMQEGVRFRTLLSFLHIETDKETNEVRSVWLQPEIVAGYDEFGLVTTEDSSEYPYRFPCDYLILAVGQRSDSADFEKVNVPTQRGRIVADETCMVEGMEGVFSGGDCVTGPSTAINAIAAGQVAAANIDEYLGYHHKILGKPEIPPAYPNPCIPTGRAELEQKDPFERKDNFDHVELSMTFEEAMREAGRCLRCDHYGCGAMEGGRGE
ncbi:MAG: FAD-dependent oxidoreductase, partial [Lachnospiraceae bacterium]|nr:FAD-dependent oxidoreductase [Lachnospiraceae bacterium]